MRPDVVVTRRTATRVVHTTATRAVVTSAPGPRGPAGLPGTPGEPGPPGPGGDGAHEAWFNFAAPEVVWVVEHGLGTKAIDVACFDPDGITEKDAEVAYPSPDFLTVTHYYAESGLVRLLY